MDPIITLPRGQFTPLNDITVHGLVNAAINLTLIIACLLFVFSLLIGGLKFILSGGGKERTDIAKLQVVNALIGIFLVFCSWAIVNFVSIFFGIDLLTFEIPTL